MDRKTLKWFTLVLAVAAVPLSAPTCTGGGALHQFSAGALVIPMDACYQTDAIAHEQSYCVHPNATGDDGIFKAYGLVYFLIKHGIAVYWVINPNKTTIDAVDMTLVDTNEPVQHYNWSNGNSTSFLGGSTRIDYRGGPFVIDGQDAATALSLLQNNSDFTQFKNSGSVDIHVVTNGFSAPVARTLAGTPPTLALLNITGGDGTGSVGVLTAYLTAAGLNFSGAGGTAQGPTHGVIYDTLAPEDFIPGTSGTSLLQQNGYKLLWVPHWEGPNSKMTGGATMTTAQLTSVLQTIGTFANNGGNLFIECAGIGTAEGAYNYNNNTVNTGFGAGQSLSESLSNSAANGGVLINSPNSPIGPPYTFNYPASPFSQIGDFPLNAVSGAINDYAVRPNGSYVSNAQRMIVESNSADLFSVVPHKDNNANEGTVVYLGGHQYNAGTAAQTAGVRLVLNTLFNLSATCIDPNTPCNTGLLGACAAGLLKCDTSGALTCTQTNQPTTETCDGVDNDCDGIVDNLPPRLCYDGPAGTENNPPCQGGTQTCVNGQWGACQGETLPTGEICNGIDDDCNGSIDLYPDGGQIIADCYDGPLGTEGVGICHGGTQLCTNGSFGPCTGEQTPEPAQCSTTSDNDCNGLPDTDACQCQNGDTQSCYDGPPGTVNVGVCHAGQQVCVNNQWGPCNGEVTPGPEVCDGTNNDYNCNGIPQDGCLLCQDGQTIPCWDGPDGGILPDGGPIGICHQGVETCQSNLWSSCQGEVFPGQEVCDGQDNDCDGQIDNNAICPPNQNCINGTCVPATCSPELNTCGEGFNCSGGTCVLGTCGDGGACPLGQACHHATCVDPCAGVTCGAGSTCSGGACIAGGCYDTPCPSGRVCSQGVCVTDPCSGVVCPSGDFCRQGYCVTSCVFVHCQAGQTCDVDGQCVPEPCGGACSASACQPDGGCGTDTCAGVGCASGQICQGASDGGICVADPCADVQCPAGVCVAGQCQRSSPTSSSSGTNGSNGSTATTSTTATTAANTTGNTTGTNGTSASNGTGGTNAATGTNGTSASNGGGNGTGANGSGTNGANGSTGTTSKVKPGCGCGAGEGLSPIWLMLGTIGLLRRRKGLAVFLLGGVLAVGAMGCTSGTKPANASSSGSGTPGTSTSSTSTGTGSTGTTSTHGSTSGTHGASGSGSTTGHTCATGQMFCGNACVDILGSTDHCGDCNTSCNVGEVCDQGFCGPSTPSNPVLTSINPDRAGVNAVLTMSLVGDRFEGNTAAGEQPSHVQLSRTPGQIDIDVVATYTDAQDLTAQLDLTGLPAGPATVRVLNSGRRVSNSLPFIIGGASLTPTLTALNPNTGDPNTQIPLTITGTLFDSTTSVHITGRGVLDQVLVRADGGDDSTVYVTLDTTGFIAGDYNVYALNGGSGRSNTLTFTVNSAAPVLTTINPTQAVTNSQLTLSAQGIDFDPSTVLHLQSTDSPPTFDQAMTTAFVSANEVEVSTASPFSLVGISPGNYQIVAENQGGTKKSNAIAFPVVSARPTLTTLSPTSGREGHSVSLTVNGQAFDNTSVIELFLPGSGSPIQQVTTFNSSSSLTCTLDLTNATPGDASIAVVNAGNLASNVLRFEIISNVGALLTLSPTSGLQGATVTLDLGGSNFENGATIHFTWLLTDGGSVDQALPTTFVSASEVQALNVDLSSDPAGPYAVTVVNPNALPSSALGFTVQPGVPVLSSVSPTSASTNTVASLTLSGSLFAPGATVHVTGTGVDTSYNPVYVDAQTLSLPAVNLSNVPTGPYTLSVINPGPHASGTQTFTVNP